MLIPSIVVNKNSSPDWFCCGDPVPICTGWLEVMLDRKLMQDDNRGLGQGVKDNVLTFEPFKLIVERRLNDVKVFPLMYVCTPIHKVTQGITYIGLKQNKSKILTELSVCTNLKKCGKSNLDYEPL